MVSKAPNPKKRDFSAYDNKKSGGGEGGRKDYGNGGGKSWGNKDGGKSYGGGGGGDRKSYGNNDKPYGNKSYGNNNGGDRKFGGGGGAGGGDWKNKSKFPPKKNEKDEPRRKRPVTSGGGDEPLDYDEVAGEEYGDGDVQMEEGGGEPAEKKPRMSKAEKAAQHAAQPHRTTLLPSHPLLQETLLPLWETARRTDTPKDERTKAVKELYAAVKGRILEISKGHKGGRVLQTIVKYGGKEERTGVAMELQPQWRQMMESKYSKFLMGKLIRYCPSIRPLLIPTLSSHLTSLLFHADASQPLSDFFDLWASSKERKLLVRGFYPKEVQIFDGLKLKGKGVDVDGEVKGLEGALEDMGDEGKGRERVLNDIEKTITDVFNATQKGALAQGIFHRLVAEYLDCVYRFLSPEEANTKMHALLESSLESLPDIVHTKDGSAVVRVLIARGNAKDRKQILQQLRKHVKPIATDGDAQMVLFTAFDCVDDTKLMGKTFVTDIVELGAELASDVTGRRSLLYPVLPTSTKHYIPSTLSSLAASAEIAREAGTSKKDPATRRKELLDYASPGLLEMIASKGEEMVRDAGSGLVVQEVMLHTIGDKSKAIDALVAPLGEAYGTEADEEDSTHILNLPHAVRTYRTLLSGGHFSRSTNAIDLIAPELRTNLAKSAWRSINQESGSGNALNIALGEGTFVMAELVQALIDAGMGSDVKKVLGETEIGEIEASTRNGAGLLVEKLRAL